MPHLGADARWGRAASAISTGLVLVVLVVLLAHGSLRGGGAVEPAVEERWSRRWRRRWRRGGGALATAVEVDDEERGGAGMGEEEERAPV